MSVYDLYQSYLNAQKQITPELSLGIMNPMLLYPQNYTDDNEYRGGGRYGNLDLSNSKTFTKDVYTDELGPPGSFEFTPQELTAYYNPTLGNYQTYAGKNINPMFSNTGEGMSLFGGILNALGLQPKPVGGFIPNSIRGYYDNPVDFLTGNRNEQSRTPEQITTSRQSDIARANALRAIRDTGGGENINTPSRSYEGSTGRAAAAFRM